LAFSANPKYIGVKANFGKSLLHDQIR